MIFKLIRGLIMETYDLEEINACIASEGYSVKLVAKKFTDGEIVARFILVYGDKDIYSGDCLKDIYTYLQFQQGLKWIKRVRLPHYKANL